MPELPEVERARKIIAAVAQGRRITKVWCADDRIVFAGVAPRTVARKLAGRRVEAVRRHGKQLWWELDERPWPLFHLGMTGQFVTPAQGPIRLASSPADLAHTWPPRFAKIHVWFHDGGEIVMTNARRLGRIRLQHDPQRERPIAALGFDPLSSMPSRAELVAALRRRDAVLKALLLDQSFAAGVGNWIADEVLYQARIDPRRRASSLSPAEAARVHAKLRSVVQRACAVDADKDELPRGWLFHRRWGRRADAVTVHGERIEHIEVAGRTTAWVPAVQK